MIPRTKVFIGSLPPGSKPEELRRLFENYGVVTECDIMNRCGFVHMETQEMAENAIKALNNTNFKGSNISVEPGRMKERSSGGGGEGSGMRGRMGGSGPPRGGGNMARGPPRRNFGSQNSQGDIGGGGWGTRNSGGGPMRHDRGGPQRGGGMPYNRNDGGNIGGGVNFQDRFQGGSEIGNRPFDMDNRQNTFNNGPPSNVGFNDRFGGNFGMGNQDKRGFALSDRQQFHGNMESSQGGGRGPLLGGNQRGSMGNNQSQMFERRPPGLDIGSGGFNSNTKNFDRRFAGSMNTGGSMFGGSQDFKSNNMRGRGGTYSNNNYNRAFPLLGGGGGNRNGPPRRDMMSNRRF